MEERYFKINSDKIKHNKFSLTKSESAHFINSLRGRTNDMVCLLDGDGCAYKSIITSIDEDLVYGVVQEKILNYGESKFDINLVIGMVKGSRMDIIFEKATELGVKSIQPIIFERCIKKKINLERVQRIIESASKQSGRSFFPKIFPVSELKNWISNNISNINILCHMKGSASLKDVEINNEKSYNIIIGPEGDFSENELNALDEIKPLTINLGPRRLRSETSAIVGIANLNQIIN
jgi:16S rRNA (uracil1498-N3)-methyltransferase